MQGKMNQKAASFTGLCKTQCSLTLQARTKRNNTDMKLMQWRCQLGQGYVSVLTSVCVSLDVSGSKIFFLCYSLWQLNCFVVHCCKNKTNPRVWRSQIDADSIKRNFSWENQDKFGDVQVFCLTLLIGSSHIYGFWYFTWSRSCKIQVNPRSPTKFTKTHEMLG